MKHQPLSVGQTVKIKPEVKEYGSRLGTVVWQGKELDWRVVKVRFDGVSRPVTFSPNEVESG